MVLLQVLGYHLQGFRLSKQEAASSVAWFPTSFSASLQSAAGTWRFLKVRWALLAAGGHGVGWGGHRWCPGLRSVLPEALVLRLETTGHC